MVGVAVISLGPSRKAQALKAAQDEVAASIRLAQSYALQGKIIPNEDVCGYGLRFYDNKTYGIITYHTSDPDCAGGTIEGNGPIETQTLKNGVVLKSTLPLGVTFSIPSASVSGFGDWSMFEFELAGETKSISINSAGLITEN